MNVKQISVFLENKAGKLTEITKYLSEHEINIRAISIADTSEFGIVRMIVNDSQKASDVLTEGGWIVSVTDVIAVYIDDKPGSLASILQILSDQNISLEYMYGFVSRHKDGACMVFRVEDTEAAKELLKSHKIRLVDPQELLSL